MVTNTQPKASKTIAHKTQRLSSRSLHGYGLLNIDLNARFTKQRGFDDDLGLDGAIGDAIAVNGSASEWDYEFKW